MFLIKWMFFFNSQFYWKVLNENLIVYRKIDKESIFMRRAIHRFIFSEKNDEEKNFIWYFRTTLLFSKFLPVRSKLVLAIYFYVPFISWEPQVVRAPTINWTWFKTVEISHLLGKELKTRVTEFVRYKNSAIKVKLVQKKSSVNAGWIPWLVLWTSLTSRHCHIWSF